MIADAQSHREGALVCVPFLVSRSVKDSASHRVSRMRTKEEEEGNEEAPSSVLCQLHLTSQQFVCSGVISAGLAPDRWSALEMNAAVS